jgi:hypothetical protein
LLINFGALEKSKMGEAFALFLIGKFQEVFGNRKNFLSSL